MTEQQNDIPSPVEGQKYIFQISSNMRIRFNADGWVEEIGRGKTMDDPLGTLLQGKPGSKRDDIYARRFYDLYARVVVLDIYPKSQSDRNNTGGLLSFSQLEPGSPLYERVSMIIAIANHHFGTNLTPLN